ncbi:helix-turn-helix transcriptional regulator [Legionella brunensis]|uniref:LuxR family transcriptional regulator n=1 Tax=Legionella brunensis TaxID=29422 RepID=A0A0W0SLD0_9GAMM|nr:helix-turn-helix transcriptional regulator [Legionella brunensis]KTC84226.1 LuxR family transcriptional regulator [Legionella brunensis]
MSFKKAKNLLHEEMLLFPDKGGIKLLFPSEVNSRKGSCSGSKPQLSDMLKLNMSVYFLDPESTTYLMNPYGAKLCGFDSVDASIGRTLLDVVQRNSALELMHNSRAVCKINAIKAFEERLVSVSGDSQSIFSIKFPWFNQESQLVGSAGLSFNLQTHSLLASLQEIRNLGLFNPVTAIFGNENYRIDNAFLAPREQECAYWLIRGYSAKQIALKLNLSFRTIEDYLQNMKDKMHVYSRQELIEKLIDDQ